MNNKELKNFKNEKMIIIKIYLGLELLRAVWGQFSFRQFLVPAQNSSQGLQVPSNVANASYRVLICCTCHFQSGSLFFVYFGFLCFQVCSVSSFCPNTRERRWSLIQAHLFSCAVGREEIEEIWGRKKRGKKGERVIKPIITLLSKNGY